MKTFRYEDFKDKHGVCGKCRCECSVTDPCCPNSWVQFEGSTWHPEDFEGHPDFAGDGA